MIPQELIDHAIIETGFALGFLIVCIALSLWAKFYFRGKNG